jgi:peptide/nickel transport system substrate-binding protein
MNMKKALMASMAVFALLFFFIPFSSAATKGGGTLRYAVISEPPTLDQHVNSADVSTTIAQHVFEGLYTFNASYDPVPMLVDKEEVKSNGLVVVLTLRQKVLFHNGKEMTSKDVVASLERWGKFGARGPVLFSHVDKVEATGKYTVQLKFKDAFAPWRALLAFISGGPVIYPSEVMENAAKTPIAETQYIGTGPYRFVERNAGRFILLERFNGYVPRGDAPSGYAGKRVALIEKLQFIPVPDVGTRVNGVKAGDYDYAETISGDLYDMLASDSSVVTLINEGVIMPLMFFNSSEGIFKGNWKLRQAVVASLDMTEALQTGVGPKNLWAADGSLMPKGTSWFTLVGAENHNKKNIEKAKSLAAAAGYKGEKFTFMVSSAYKLHYDIGQVFAKAMKDAGFNVDLQVYDWATLVSKRGDPKQWDLFFTHHGFIPDPALFTFMSENYPGWWATPEKNKLAQAYTTAPNQKERIASWAQFQKLVYEQFPIIKVGDVYNFDLTSPKLKDLGKTQLIWPKFWGVSFK